MKKLTDVGTLVGWSSGGGISEKDADLLFLQLAVLLRSTICTDAPAAVAGCAHGCSAATSRLCPYRLDFMSYREAKRAECLYPPEEDVCVGKCSGFSLGKYPQLRGKFRTSQGDVTNCLLRADLKRYATESSRIDLLEFVQAAIESSHATFRSLSGDYGLP